MVRVGLEVLMGQQGFMMFYEALMGFVAHLKASDFASKMMVLIELRDNFPAEFALAASEKGKLGVSGKDIDTKDWDQAIRYAEEVPLPKRFYVVPVDGKPEMKIVDVTRGPHTTVPLHAYRDARLLLSSLFPPGREEG